MNGRAWTADERSTLRRLVAAGLTDGEIGTALGRARETVQRQRKALRLRSGQSLAMSAALGRLHARRRRSV
jgi:IS30 family transposase